jgi:hypothetical protein
MIMASASPELVVKPATIFAPPAIVRTSLCGLILVVPVLVAMMVVSVLHFGTLTFLIPLATIAVATFFLPLGFGNPYVAWLARPLQPPGDPSQSAFLVQLTRRPRFRSGFLAILEDADDIGFLSFSDTSLTFEGDSIRLKVPYARIENLRLQNSGWRALFAYGPQTVFEISGLPDGGSFAFAERASWHLPGSRRNAGAMYREVAGRTERQK